MKRRYLVGLLVAVLAIVAGGLIARAIVFRAAERNLMVLRKNGPETPADFGVAYRLSWIQSGDRRLEASTTIASSSCPDRVAALLFHGRGETISDWAKLQAFLAGRCVSSEVFDYSGHGSSTPPATIGNLDADAVAAYSNFARQFPRPWRRCVLSHSMGGAPMLHGLGSFQPAPDCVVVANAFSSVEDFARLAGAPGPVAALLGGTWNNVAAIRHVREPLMIVQSDSDQVIAPIMAARLAAAAPPQTQRVKLHGFGHNALYKAPSMAWWSEPLSFIHGSAGETKP